MAGYKIEHDKAHWDSVVAKLRLADATAQEKFNAALKEAAAPIMGEVQAAAEALPTHGTKHTGLRGRLAAGVGVHGITDGVEITASYFLSRVTDNGPAGWRHPVYGNRANWVHQDGGSWFKEVIQNDGGIIEERLQEALQQLADSMQ